MHEVEEVGGEHFFSLSISTKTHGHNEVDGQQIQNEQKGVLLHAENNSVCGIHCPGCSDDHLSVDFNKELNSWKIGTSRE